MTPEQRQLVKQVCNSLESLGLDPLSPEMVTYWVAPCKASFDACMDAVKQPRRD